MSKSRPDRTRTTPKGIVLGLRAFEKISAVEGIQLTEEMRRDLHAFERLDMSSEERTRFIIEHYGRKLT